MKWICNHETKYSTTHMYHFKVRFAFNKEYMLLFCSSYKLDLEMNFEHNYSTTE